MTGLYSTFLHLFSSHLFLHLPSIGSVDQNIPKPRFPIHLIHHRLIRILHISLFHHRFNLVILNELQHFFQLGRGTDGGSGEMDVGHDEGNELEVAERTFGETDKDEGTVRFEEGDVAGEGHVFVVCDERITRKGCEYMIATIRGG